ncbi:murein biosynthesis integral membrane protein MurJ [Ruminococcus albus]|nr:murein biosynthesis integral membrane protein MurJ [Ruminococcus albus]MCC3351466.1 murein biosynthesis integral membrane protein MurJ [Ruminococcus albus 8]
MNNKIIKNVGVILGCSIVAKVLSYIWEATLAAFLGASDQADAFYMTTSIFGILYPILDLGIWKVFLPAYKKMLVEKKESDAERIANISITLFFVLSIALVIFLIVFAQPLVAVMASGFDSDKRKITIEYLRISAPTYLLMAASSVVGAMLQSREKFLGSQIREIGTHISKIIFVIICFRFLNIYAAVIAMIVGSIFRLLIQLPFINWKWKFRFDFHFKDKEILPMIKGLPSVAVTAAIVHINGLVDKMVASGAVTGAVACLNYGNKLMNVFSGMISTAISTAVYPNMIQCITNKEEGHLRRLLTKVISSLLFCIIPISIFCLVFSSQLVSVAFERGAFDSSATEITAEVFVGYSLGMLFIGIASVVTNVFYGYGDTKITMNVSLIEIVLNIIFDLMFVQIFGVAGLAFATSISAAICLCIRFLLLKKYIRISLKSISFEGLKILAISTISAFIPYILITNFLDVNKYISIILCAILFGTLYIGLALILHIETLYYLKNLFYERLHK